MVCIEDLKRIGDTIQSSDLLRHMWVVKCERNRREGIRGREQKGGLLLNKKS